MASLVARLHDPEEFVRQAIFLANAVFNTQQNKTTPEAQALLDIVKKMDKARTGTVQME